VGINLMMESWKIALINMVRALILKLHAIQHYSIQMIHAKSRYLSHARYQMVMKVNL
jgi:hypothetical protein